MNNWNHSESWGVMVLQMSSWTWCNIVFIRIPFLPVCSNRSIISFFLSRPKSIREMSWFFSSWNSWVIYLWSTHRIINWVGSWSYRFLSCFLYEVFLSFSFIDWPIIASPWWRRVSFVSLINIIMTRSNIAAIISQPCNFGNQNTFSNLLIRLLYFIFLVKIKFQYRGEKPARNRWNR